MSKIKLITMEEWARLPPDLQAAYLGRLSKEIRWLRTRVDELNREVYAKRRKKKDNNSYLK